MGGFLQNSDQLGTNIAFLDETTFLLANKQTTHSGVSGIRSVPVTTAKVLFNKIDRSLLTTKNLSSIVSDVSAKIDDTVFRLSINNAYHNEIISVINADRLSTQFTFVTSGGGALATATAAVSGFVTLSAQGNNSVGPTLRRLYNLGYV
jgi:hypothetical protein